MKNFKKILILLLEVLLIVFITLFDIVSTLEVIKYGGLEFNPLYSILLSFGTEYFIIGRFILTLFVIIILTKIIKSELHYRILLGIILLIWFIAGINNMFILNTLI